MRIRSGALLAAAFLCFGAAAVSAQTRSKLADELLKLELDMSRAAFQTADNPENRAHYVTVLERVAVRVCGSDGAAAAEAADLPECEACAELLRDVDGRNPVAACITHGHRSAACDYAFSFQRVADLESKPRSVSAGKTGSDTGLDRQLSLTKHQGRLADLKNKIDQLTYHSRGAHELEPKIKENLVAALNEATALACEYAELGLSPVGGTPPAASEDDARAPVSLFDKSVPASVSPDTAEKPERPLDPDDPMDRVLAELEANTSRAASGPPVEFGPPLFERTRFVSRECLTYADRLLQVDPQSRIAHCRRTGPFAPACSGAKTTTQHAAPGKTPGSETKAFESF